MLFLVGFELERNTKWLIGWIDSWTQRTKLRVEGVAFSEMIAVVQKMWEAALDVLVGIVDKLEDEMVFVGVCWILERMGGGAVVVGTMWEGMVASRCAPHKTLILPQCPQICHNVSQIYVSSNVSPPATVQTTNMCLSLPASGTNVVLFPGLDVLLAICTKVCKKCVRVEIDMTSDR